MVWDEKYDLGHRNFFFWGRKCGRGIKPEQGSSWGYVCGFLNEKFLSSIKKVLVVEKMLQRWSVRPLNHRHPRIQTAANRPELKLHSRHIRNTDELTEKQSVCFTALNTSRRSRVRGRGRHSENASNYVDFCNKQAEYLSWELCIT